MRVIANKILLLIESRGVKLNHDRETYIYGLSQWLYTIFSTSLLLLWGIIWGYSFESVILILVFMQINLTEEGFMPIPILSVCVQ